MAYTQHEWTTNWHCNGDIDSTTTTVNMLVFSDPVATTFANGALADQNLSGLYLLLFFTIGGLVRSCVNRIGNVVVFEDMDDVRIPVSLCMRMSRCRQLSIRADTTHRKRKDQMNSLDADLEKDGFCSPQIKWLKKLLCCSQLIDEQEIILSASDFSTDYLVLEHQMFLELIKLYRQPDELYRRTTIDMSTISKDKREWVIDGKTYDKGIWSDPPSDKFDMLSDSTHDEDIGRSVRQQHPFSLMRARGSARTGDAGELMQRIQEMTEAEAKGMLQTLTIEILGANGSGVEHGLKTD